MATLERNARDLIDEIGVYMGWDEVSGEDRDWCLLRLNEGYRRYLRGVFRDEAGIRHVHSWSFLMPTASIILWKTATGTMATVGTAVTATAAAFHATMIGSTLKADTSGTEYTITAYTSTTVVTVDSAADADDGDTFTVTSDGTNRLPSDWGGAISDPVYGPDEDDSTGLVECTPEEMDALHRDSDSVGTPDKWCVYPPSVASTAQAWEVKVHPIPSEDKTIVWSYRRRVDALTDSQSVYPAGGEDHTDTILACALARAEYRKDHKAGDMEIEAMVLLRDSAAIDRGMFSSTDEQETIGWEADG